MNRRFEKYLKESNNRSTRSKWIEVGLASGFNDEYDAEEHLDHIMDMIDELPEEVTLYRLVFLDSIDELDKIKPGIHYVMDKKSLVKNHYDQNMYTLTSSHGYGEEPYLITVKINKSNIDRNMTIDNNMRYPNEKEISLKDKGKGAKIVKINKLK